jgi:hypothetical protein
VISAKQIATTGGNKDHNVPTGSVIEPVSAQITANATAKATIKSLGISFLTCILILLLFFKIKTVLSNKMKSTETYKVLPIALHKKSDSLQHILLQTNSTYRTE